MAPVLQTIWRAFQTVRSPGSGPSPSGGGPPPSGWGRRASKITDDSKVTQKHNDWVRMAPAWGRIKDTLDGTDAVRVNAHKYIPATMKQNKYPELFEAMIKRTPFVNYVARAVDAIEGMVFRHDPDVTVP